MPHCSSNLTDNARNKEIGCSTKNYVQNTDDHYEQNLLFQTENLLKNNEVKDIDLCITKTVEAPHFNKNGRDCNISTTSTAFELKKEIDKNYVDGIGRRKFTKEEDLFLKQGIEKFGKGAWSNILKCPLFKFQPNRTRDSLRMRAEAAAFKKIQSKK